MKYAEIIIRFIVLGFSLLILSGSPVLSQETWTKTYGGPGSDVANDIQKTPDGGFIIVGSTTSFGAGKSDIYLLKINTFGDTLWTKTIGGPEDEFGNSIVVNSDGSLVIAGSTGSFGAGGSDAYLVKTDAIGDTLWTRTYGGNGDDRAFAIAKTFDGGFIVTGSFFDTAINENKALLLRTDAFGDSLWSKALQVKTNTVGKGVIQTNDGGFALTGSTVLKSGFGNSILSFLMKTDSNGDSVFARTDFIFEESSGNTVIETVENGFIVLVEIDTTYGHPLIGTLSLVKFDDIGNTIWGQNYSRAYTYHGKDVINTSEGGYILTGTADNFTFSNFDVYLVKTDVSGDTLWTRFIGDENNEVGNAVIEHDDGSYIIAGEIYGNDANDKDVLIIKTDDQRLITGVENEDDAYTPLKYSLDQNYPNPFNITTKISFNITSTELVKVSIFDISGSLVKVIANRLFQAGQHVAIWNGTNDSGNIVSSGIYFYNLQTSNTSITKKMILIK